MSRHIEGLTVGERLERLFAHLGIKRAHVGTAPPGDLMALHATRPSSIGAVVFMNPPRLAERILAEFRGRAVVFTGDQGPVPEALLPLLESSKGIESHVAGGSEAAAWTDYAAEQASWAASVLVDFLARQDETRPATRLFGPAEGPIAGIDYLVRGKGPALVLLPAAMAPSQWNPLVEQLSEYFSVIVLAGAHLGYPALLEDRGKDPSCLRLMRALFEEMEVRPEDRLLEIGCGTGVFLRWLAAQVKFAPPLIGIDLNSYLLREAAALAEQAGLAGRLAFLPGNAEALPFDNESFDLVLCFTVLEECDADNALKEMHRVLRPGGRAAVVVRATDIPLYWHLPVPAEIARKIKVPNPLVGPAGCADASICKRLEQNGFNDVRYWLGYSGTADVSGPYWTLYRQNVATPNLAPEDLPAWDAAHEIAARDGGAYMAQPVHCAVGTKRSHE